MRRRAAIKKSMKGNKRANTKPELLVRQRLRAAGLTGYRLEWKVPGKPDIAFPGRKIAIFVNGCFWHRCPKCNPSQPKRNVEFWEAKFRRNVERDHAAVAALTQMGWTPITIWECELKKIASTPRWKRSSSRYGLQSRSANSEHSHAPHRRATSTSQTLESP